MFTVLLIACINDKREKKWPTPCVLRGGRGRFGGFLEIGLKEGVKKRPSSFNNNAAKNYCRRKYVAALLGSPFFTSELHYQVI